MTGWNDVGSPPRAISAEVSIDPAGLPLRRGIVAEPRALKREVAAGAMAAVLLVAEAAHGAKRHATGREPAADAAVMAAPPTIGTTGGGHVWELGIDLLGEGTILGRG